MSDDSTDPKFKAGDVVYLYAKKSEVVWVLPGIERSVVWYKVRSAGYLQDTVVPETNLRTFEEEVAKRLMG